MTDCICGQWATAHLPDCPVAIRYREGCKALREEVERVTHGAPTRDAEQAVREARSLFNQECQAADTVYDADVQDRLDALITAVRQAERARIRGIVEGVAVHQAFGVTVVSRSKLLAALDGAE